jgi:hypothetical protein
MWLKEKVKIYLLLLLLFIYLFLRWKGKKICLWIVDEKLIEGQWLVGLVAAHINIYIYNVCLWDGPQGPIDIT